MRQIEFRAKKQDGNGEWVYGLLTDQIHDYIIQEEKYPFIAHLAIPETIGQYVMTINNRRIYEKDILIQWGQPYLVEWVDYPEHQGYNIALDDNEIELIGNIIDNPKLLEKFNK